MALILIRILLIILLITLFVLFGVKKDEYNMYTFKLNKKQLYSLIPLVLFFLSFCLAYVPANNVGIKWSVFGGTQKETLDEGITIKSPLDKVENIPTTVEERTIENVELRTRDAQSVEGDINVKFVVDKKDVYKVYKRFGSLDNLKKNIVSNYSQKAVESVVTKYNVIDAIGSKKNTIYEESTNVLEKMFADEGVRLVSLTIKNMEPDDAIKKAISDEAVAKKAVETAEQNRQKAKKEAETKVIEAEAEAKANKLKERSLTKEILTQQMLEKWDGKLPAVTDGSSGLFNMDSLIK